MGVASSVPITSFVGGDDGAPWRRALCLPRESAVWLGTGRRLAVAASSLVPWQGSKPLETQRDTSILFVAEPNRLPGVLSPDESVFVT